MTFLTTLTLVLSPGPWPPPEEHSSQSVLSTSESIPRSKHASPPVNFRQCVSQWQHNWNDSSTPNLYKFSAAIDPIQKCFIRSMNWLAVSWCWSTRISIKSSGLWRSQKISTFKIILVKSSWYMMHLEPLEFF